MAPGFIATPLAWASAMAATRTLFVLIVALVSFGPLSTDLYLPALPQIGRSLSADATTVQLTLGVFVAGFALAQLVYGPLSDRYGRRPVVLVGLVLFLLASLACALAPSIEVLIVARLIQGIGASCGPVLGRAVIRDVYDPADAARVLSYVATATSITPILGPMMGGGLTDLLGWQVNFWVLAAIGLAVLVASVALLGETNRYRDPSATRFVPLVANHVSLLRHRRYVGYTLIVAFSYSGIFSFLSGSSFLLIDGLGLRPSIYGLSFGLAVVGYSTGTLLSGRLARRLGIDRSIVVGLVLKAVGALGLTCVTWAGWLSTPTVIVPVMVFLAGCGFTMPNGYAGSIAPFPRIAGTAAALVGFTQMALAALVGWAVVALADGTGRSIAAGLVVTALGGALAYVRLCRRSVAAATSTSARG